MIDHTGFLASYIQVEVVTTCDHDHRLYVNNKMLQGLRPERGMLKKVLFAAGKKPKSSY